MKFAFPRRAWLAPRRSAGLGGMGGPGAPGPPEITG